MNDIYNRILLETKKNGLDGNKIALLLGLKKSPLTDWKNGKSAPTTEQIIKLCDIFAVSADYLLTGSTYFNLNNITVEEQEWLDLYKQLSKTADSHTKDECIGFVKGYIERGRK